MDLATSSTADSFSLTETFKKYILYIYDKGKEQFSVKGIT